MRKTVDGLSTRLITIVVAGFLINCAGIIVVAQEPRFADYAVKVESVKAKTIDFSKSPAAARTFRTRLSDALKDNVNFAGSYVLAAWGCGTGCRDGAVIDGKTGRVVFPKELGAVSDWFGPPDEGFDIFTFRKDSRLLIVRGFPGYAGAKAGTYYFEWTGSRFRLLKFIAHKKK
jgi:hypothetical protein